MSRRVPLPPVAGNAGVGRPPHGLRGPRDLASEWMRPEQELVEQREDVVRRRVDVRPDLVDDDRLLGDEVLRAEQWLDDELGNDLEGAVGTAACRELARAIGADVPVGLAPHSAELAFSHHHVHELRRPAETKSHEDRSTRRSESDLRAFVACHPASILATHTAATVDAIREAFTEHQLIAPGEASVVDDHYGRPRPDRPPRGARPRTPAEHEFLALGQVAEAFLTGAAAAGVTKLPAEIAEILTLKAAHGEPALLAALERAVTFGRWRAGDVSPLRTCRPHRAPAPARQESLTEKSGRCVSAAKQSDAPARPRPGARSARRGARASSLYRRPALC